MADDADESCGDNKATTTSSMAAAATTSAETDGGVRTSIVASPGGTKRPLIELDGNDAQDNDDDDDDDDQQQQSSPAKTRRRIDNAGGNNNEPNETDTGPRTTTRVQDGQLIRGIVVPRSDPDNPKSTFGINVRTDAPTGRTVITHDYPTPSTAAQLGIDLDILRKNDVVVAVNGAVVYNVREGRVEKPFRGVVERMVQTEAGRGMRIDVLRPDGAGATSTRTRTGGAAGAAVAAASSSSIAAAKAAAPPAATCTAAPSSAAPVAAPSAAAASSAASAQQPKAKAVTAATTAEASSSAAKTVNVTTSDASNKPKSIASSTSGTTTNKLAMSAALACADTIATGSKKSASPKRAATEPATTTSTNTDASAKAMTVGNTASTHISAKKQANPNLNPSRPTTAAAATGAPKAAASSPKRGAEQQQQQQQQRTPTKSNLLPNRKQHTKHRDTTLRMLVEIPPYAQVGDLINIRIPATRGRREEVLGIICPENIIANPPRRYIRIVLPGDEPPPIRGATKLPGTSSPPKDRRSNIRISSPSISRKRRFFSSSGGVDYDDDDFSPGEGDAKWEIQWDDYEQSASRVGRGYQVTAFPRAKTAANVTAVDKVVKRRGSYKEMGDWSDEPPLGCDQIWCPQKADEAIRQGEEIDAFLDALPSHEKAAGMQALHETDYAVAEAKLKLEKLRSEKALDVQGAPLTPEQAELFRSEVQNTSKSFVDIASSLGVSVIAVLVHYYKVYKQTDDYKGLKHRLRHEMDVCYICDDGGDLILCDGCSNAFHLDCLDPPLDKIPEGEWLCPLCVRKGKQQEKDNLRMTEAGPSETERPTAVATLGGNGYGARSARQSRSSSPVPMRDEESILSSSASVKPKNKKCSVIGCTKFKQNGCDGKCRSHWKEAEEEEEEEKKTAESSTTEVPWNCHLCNRANPAEKRRCSGCKGWKGGRRSSKTMDVEELSVTDVSTTKDDKSKTLDIEEPSVIDVSITSAAEVPWNCHLCNRANPAEKRRCSGCKGWKGGRRSSKTMDVEELSVTDVSTTKDDKSRTLDIEESSVIDVSITSAAEVPWNCHLCNRANPAEKRRCSGCKGWKGGRRSSKTLDAEESSVTDVSTAKDERGRRRSSKTLDVEESSVTDMSITSVVEGDGWNCLRCDRANPIEKRRCSGCKGWKDGKKKA